MHLGEKMNYIEIVNSVFFNNTYAKIEKLKKEFPVNHGFVHISGVIRNAKYISDLFGLDAHQKELLLIASALHDIGYLVGRDDHAKNGGLLAYEYLTDKLPEQDIKIVCNAISCHGGKNETDYQCPVAMCLILADKLDFAKHRYKDDGKEHKNLPIFMTIQKVELKHKQNNQYILEILTTNPELFVNLQENYFFNKLFAMFEKLKKVCGYKVEIEFVKE